MLFRLFLGFALATLLTGPPRRAAASELDLWRWRRIDVGSVAALGSAALTALAVDTRSGRIALGHTRGVAIGVATDSASGGSGFERWRFRSAARLPAVTDLHFAEDGALWIATLDGLWKLDPRGVLRNHSPAPGEAAHRVRRVRSAGALVAVGTDSGAYVSSDGLRWQAVDGDLPSGPVSVLALAPGDPSPLEPEARLWLSVGGALWQTEIRALSEQLSFENSRIGRAPGVAPGTPTLDLTVELSSAELVLVHPGTLVRFEPRSPARFVVRRPVLPPGAEASRIFESSGRVWLGTDRGLLSATALEGPWRRIAELPVGARIHALAASPPAPGESEALWVLADRALYRGTRGSPPADPTAVQAVAAKREPSVLALGDSTLMSGEPSIREVQEAALRHVGLTTELGSELREGLGRRGWLPRLSLNGGYVEDRDQSEDFDQSFVSGDTRHLFDHDREWGLGWHVSVSASWDFATLVYDPEAIDFSREERQVIAFRDDVLDEINQIYFERMALLLELETATGVESRAARLRAQELAAGLDGWTGGWFGERLRATARTEW